MADRELGFCFPGFPQGNWEMAGSGWEIEGPELRRENQGATRFSKSERAVIFECTERERVIIHMFT